MTLWEDKCYMVQCANDVLHLVQCHFEAFDPRYELVDVFHLFRLR
jgi:hypothetical protein